MYMRRICLVLVVLVLCISAFAQEITVRFTGQLNGTDYCRLDSIAVTNLTRNWTETVEYPDTIIVLGGTVGTSLNIVAIQGLGQNVPNPFDCETSVELSVSQREDVRMQLIDATGKVYAEHNGALDAGVHVFDISAANPQTYILNAVVGDKSYSIRMVNVGTGCGSSIKYAGVSGCITAKLTSAKEFQIGDNMRYVGYATIEGERVASDAFEQMQAVNQYVTLSFTHYFPPRVETLAATGITQTTAVLHGNITDDGASSIASRGFYYGTSVDNLSQNVTATETGDEFSYTLNGLLPSTTYYYKAYAINNAGMAMGNIATFTTENVLAPTVETVSATNITHVGAKLRGNVTSDCGAMVTARGFMYGASANNLTQTVQSGSGIGSFAESITGLSSETTYYYKAYATNSAGTTYGEVMQFTTECDCGGSVTITDYDGNQYGTVKIGTQCWMNKNLRTSHFADGTSIPYCNSMYLSGPLYSAPDGSSTATATYGFLYNIEAAMNGASASSANPSNVQGVCPNGWHLPSKAEWTQLVNHLKRYDEYWCGDNNTYIAKSLASTTGWTSSTLPCAIGNNPSDNNYTGFGALPAGNREVGEGYHGFGYEAYFWTTSNYSYGGWDICNLSYSGNAVSIGYDNNYSDYVYYSVRCVRDF